MVQAQGYIGVYGDELGTVPCVTVPPMVLTTLYVVATTGGVTASGISGVEFRIQVQNPAGYFFSFVGPDSAQVLGDPLNGPGCNINWRSCKLPNGAGKVNLGTIQVMNAGSGAPTDIVVVPREPPLSDEHPCPLFVLCDAPSYSLQCTVAPPDSISCLNR
jgi:hypothetical protein